MKLRNVIVFFIAFVLILSACNLPTPNPTQQVNANAVFTAAAQTVEVQLTQNALLNAANPVDTLPPPINTIPPAPETPASAAIETTIPTMPIVASSTSAPVMPTASCDAAQFINDVSIPDGTVFPAGATFTKTWRLKNIGTCTWNSSYALVFDSDNAMGGASSVALPGTTAPGASIDISANMQAPAKEGTFRGYWGITNASGARIPVAGGSNGRSFYVEIKVGSGGASGGTDSPGKFAVISVGFSTTRSEPCASGSGKYIVNATVTTNKAGTVTYTWIRSDGATGAVNSGTLVFDSAGSQVINFEWNTTVSGLWIDLVIDNPNHQQFGRANLTCS